MEPLEEEMDRQMDRLLEDLRSEGELESRGRFTIDLDRARARARFQFANPEQALLRVFQAVVRAGSTSLRYRASWGDLFIGASGGAWSLQASDLGEALANPFELADGPLRHLTFALYGLIGWKRCREFTLVARGASGVRVTWEGGRLSVAEAHLRDGLLEALAERGLEGISGLSLGVSYATSRLRLARSLAYAPIPIYQGTRPTNTPYFETPSLGHRVQGRGALDLGERLVRSAGSAEWYLVARDYAPDLVPLPAVSRCPRQRWTPCDGLLEPYGPELVTATGPGRVPRLRMEGRALVSCHAALAQTRAHRSECVFVKDGVIIHREHGLFDRPGRVAVLSCRDLHLDLAGFGLVHDEQFRRIMERLREGSRWMDEEG